MTRLLFWMVVSAAFAAPPLAAQQTSAPGAVITTAQAVAEAIQNNPSLIAERLGISVAQTASITAALRPNPVVSVGADTIGHGTIYNQNQNTSPTDFNLRVDYPIERAHKRELRMDAAGYQRRIVAARVEDFVRRLRLDVTLACIDVIEAKTKLALANDNLQALNGIVSLNEARLRGGALAPLELTRSRVAMLQFRASVKTAELAVATARSRLQTLLGRQASDPLVDISDPLQIPLPASGPDLENIRARALDLRPDIRAIQLDQARSQADLRLQIAQGKVDYTVGSEYHNTQGITGPVSSMGFFFSAPLPVNNRNQGEIARARAEQSQIARSLAALQSQISGEVSTAYQEFEATRLLVADIERDLLKPSAEARDTTRYVYQAGASTLIDVLDAQRAYNETMSTYYDAEADFHRAAVRLAAVAGLEGMDQGVNP